MGRLHIFISGRVQGVFYRDFTRKCAMLLDVRGWARNLPDGRVEIIAEGNEHDTKEFLAKLHVGPDNASVDGIISEKEDYTGEFSKFEIF